MIHGDPEELIKRLTKEKEEELMRIKKEYNKNRREIINKFKKELIKQEQALKNKLRKEQEKNKNEIMITYKLKELTIKEELTKQFAEKIITKLKSKLVKWSAEHNNKYKELIKKIIMKSKKELGGTKHKVIIGRKDKWAYKGVTGDFEHGVIVYNKNEKEYINNTLESIINQLLDEAYKEASEAIIWE